MQTKTIYLSLAMGALLIVKDPVQLPADLLKTADFTDATLECEQGKIQIRSEAPLEIIEAQSNRLRGLIDPARQSFAWSVEIKSLNGFNSPLQREHFNENYLESNKFPRASFMGKIIEKIDFQQDGVYDVRAKGKFTVHGVEQERIIKSRLSIKKGKAVVQSTFTVLLADHDITIPRIVYQKIAEEVTVKIDAELN